MYTHFIAIPILRMLFSSATQRPTHWILYNVQYIVLHPLFRTKAFLIKLFENFEEQVEDFFNVTSDSLVKNSAIQLKSNKAIILKYFNILNVGVLP